ncbi:MAG: hypothetical protein Ct9H300mP28_10020 [Pseudomonadota bacterium]|nr:MAG: hypothetical protein Ct9H300mP28_10020 [Pseudomonadota bacterium]
MKLVHVDQHETTGSTCCKRRASEEKMLQADQMEVEELLDTMTGSQATLCSAQNRFSMAAMRLTAWQLAMV